MKNAVTRRAFIHFCSLMYFYRELRAKQGGGWGTRKWQIIDRTSVNTAMDLPS